MKHQPKGGMRAVCVNKNHDCSNLEFDKMPVYASYKQGVERVKIVICTEFKKPNS